MLFTECTSKNGVVHFEPNNVVHLCSFKFSTKISNHYVTLSLNEINFFHSSTTHAPYNRDQNYATF